MASDRGLNTVFATRPPACTPCINPTHSKRSRALSQDIRAFVTNEVNRVLNALVYR